MIEREDILEKEFDFSKAKRNPYAKMLRKQITININNEAIEYFKSEAERTGIPYQTLINLYLTDCAKNNRKLDLSWK
jgi:predicted DNA binding CopG/RHH family protein